MANQSVVNGTRVIIDIIMLILGECMHVVYL